MATADVSYVPGALTAVAGDQCWALVDTSPDSPAVTRIWQQLGKGVAADVLLAGLLTEGIGGTPGFALLVAGPGRQHRLFCRGTVGATVVSGTADGSAPPGPGPALTERIHGAGLLTWREQVVERAQRIFLGGPPAETSLRLPATSGVLLAGCVVIDFTNFAARDTVSYGPQQPDTITMTHPGSLAAQASARSPAAGQHLPEDRGLAAAPGPSLPFALGPGGPGGPPASPGRPGGREPASVPGPLLPFAASPAGPFGGPSRPDAPGPAVAPVPPMPTAAEAAGNLNGGAGHDGDYDFFWGATQSRSVEGAAMRGTGESDPAPPGHFPHNGIPAPGPPGPAPRPPGGLIDAPTWLPGSSESASLTVRRGELAGIVARTTPPDRIGPVVPALLCPGGHVNPPSGTVCRRCGAVLPHDPVPVPRPVLGVLRLSLGDLITLDRGVLMGRNPRTDFGGSDGEERPHVVKLPSADGEISRTHLKVSLDGWHVLVTDLNSTNGTLVTLPGRDPQQLRPGEPIPIQPGTVVTLADGIDFRYEVTD